MKGYTVKRAAEILGMKKSSLHSIIQMGAIKSVKEVRNGVPTRIIPPDELERYAKKKIKKHIDAIEKMDKGYILEELADSK